MAEVIMKKARRDIKRNDEPATSKQLKYIRVLEKKHNRKFTGKTKLQASSFIDKCMGKGN